MEMPERSQTCGRSMHSRTSCLVRISSSLERQTRENHGSESARLLPRGRLLLRSGADRPGREVAEDRAIHGDYSQVLVLAVPPLEEVGPPEVSAEFARIANDELAELVQRFPDRFAGFAAALPLSDVELALRELDRALTQLGALGAQLYTNVLGVALDDPRFEPLFTRLEDAGRAVWLHPTRSAAWADYPAESSPTLACGGQSAGPTRPPPPFHASSIPGTWSVTRASS